RPSPSAERELITETTRMPGAISMVTSALTGPFTMSRTVPRNWLRALVFIVIAPCRGDSPWPRMLAIGRSVNMQACADRREARAYDSQNVHQRRDLLRRAGRDRAGRRHPRLRRRQPARGDDRDRAGLRRAGHTLGDDDLRPFGPAARAHR